jgi:hypothetical protein
LRLQLVQQVRTGRNGISIREFPRNGSATNLVVRFQYQYLSTGFTQERCAY